MSKHIFLDIMENNVAPRNVNAEDITHILPLSSGGCVVALRSIGIVKCRQTVEEITRQIMEVATK